MEVNDIRPKNLDEGKNQALEEDLTRLRAYTQDFIKVTCPACESKRRETAYEKYGFHFDACKDCGTAYMNPRATPEILNEFYSNSVLYEYWNKYIFPASQEVRRERIFKPRVRSIIDLAEHYKTARNGIVEIGAGFGTFCQEMQEEDFFERVVAVEPGKALAESCRRVGIETIEDGIENVSTLDFDVDFIVSFEVIEHLFSPYEYLKNCHRLLSDNGLAVVTCPNYQGFDIMTLGVDSESLDAEHINMFNPNSIEVLFQRAGFEILECSTPGKLDADIVRSAALDNIIDLKDQPFLQKVLIKDWEKSRSSFQEFLVENKMSSNMMVVAKKLSSL